MHILNWCREVKHITTMAYLIVQAKYSKALDAAPPMAPQRAVYFANRAAAALKLQQVSGGEWNLGQYRLLHTAFKMPPSTAVPQMKARSRRGV